MNEVPRYMRHAPRPNPPAAWELDSEAEYWRDMASDAESPDARIWCWRIADEVEHDAAALRARQTRRMQSPFDTRETVQRVKDAADIIAVFGTRVPETMQRAALRSGSQVHILCPFHREKTPSLVLYREDARWWCFGCNQGGDSISAVMLLDNLDFWPAVMEMAREFRVDVPAAAPRGVRVPAL